MRGVPLTNKGIQSLISLAKEVHPMARERLFANKYLNAWFPGVPINIPFALLVIILPGATCAVKVAGQKITVGNRS